MTAPVVLSITSFLLLCLAKTHQASEADSENANSYEDFVERYTSPKNHISFKRLVQQARAIYNIQGEHPYFHHARRDEPLLEFGNDDTEVSEYLNSALKDNEEKLIEINLEGVPEHHLTPVHVRTKREIVGETSHHRYCLIPKAIPENTTELMKSLNNTMMLGVIPFDQTKKLVMFQPSTCPNDWRWFPTGEQRYRATCPWNIVNVDLGMDAFPRYVFGAYCLCPNCVTFKTMGCVNIKFPLPYLVLVGCNDKIAIMMRKMKIIDVGCTCSAPKPNDNRVPMVPELPPLYLRPPNTY